MEHPLHKNSQPAHRNGITAQRRLRLASGAASCSFQSSSDLKRCAWADGGNGHHSYCNRDRASADSARIMDVDLSVMPAAAPSPFTFKVVSVSVAASTARIITLKTAITRRFRPPNADVSYSTLRCKTAVPNCPGIRLHISQRWWDHAGAVVLVALPASRWVKTSRQGSERQLS